MFEARIAANDVIELSGRLDASQVEKAKAVFDAISNSCTVSFKEVEYISSAGLGVLLATQKRLNDLGKRLKLSNLHGHVKDIFYYAGFDKIFEIE